MTKIKFLRRLSKVLFFTTVFILLYLFSRIPQTIVYAKPEIVESKYIETFIAEVTAYNSEVSQTDSDPFIAANGKNVFDGGIACPARYKFGTRIEIEGRVYECNDRMAKRYRGGNFVDIWMESKEDSKNWGRKTLEIKIIK